MVIQFSPKYKNNHIILETISLDIPRERRLEEKEPSKRSVDRDATSKKHKNKSLQLSLCLNSLGIKSFLSINWFKKDYTVDNRVVIPQETKGKDLD